MPQTEPQLQIIPLPDRATLELIRFAIAIAVADEMALRAGAVRAFEAGVPVDWLEELLLQSYLFVGFPRALNAVREWRRASGLAATEEDEGEDSTRIAEWIERGERTCEIVYGSMYEKLRRNIRELHPALDAWMIAEGYGKVLGRHGLDLARCSGGAFRTAIRRVRSLVRQARCLVWRRKRGSAGYDTRLVFRFRKSMRMNWPSVSVFVKYAFPRLIALTRLTNSTSDRSRASMNVLIMMPARRQSATSRMVCEMTVASSPMEFL